MNGIMERCPACGGDFRWHVRGHEVCETRQIAVAQTEARIKNEIILAVKNLVIDCKYFTGETMEHVVDVSDINALIQSLQQPASDSARVDQWREHSDKSGHSIKTVFTGEPATDSATTEVSACVGGTKWTADDRLPVGYIVMTDSVPFGPDGILEDGTHISGYPPLKSDSVTFESLPHTDTTDDSCNCDSCTYERSDSVTDGSVSDREIDKHAALSTRDNESSKYWFSSGARWYRDTHTPARPTQDTKQ